MFRLLLLSLLLSVCVAPVVAQSLPDKNSVSSPPLLDRLISPPKFQVYVPTPEIRLHFRAPEPRDHFPALAQDDAACYSIRSYRVTRDNPGSDLTRPAGYSECQPAARFQVKTAVDLREIAPR